MKNLEQDAILANMEKANLKTEIREGLQKLAADLQEIRLGFENSLYQIKHDKRLTDHGKKEKKQKLGDEILEKLKPFANIYGEHLRQVKIRLLNGGKDQQQEKSDLQRVLEHLKRSELRRMYSVEEMDPLQIEAIGANDPGFIEAVLTSPRPLLPKAKIDQLVMAKAESESPELAAELEDLNFAAGTVDSITRGIQSDIKAAGWRDPSDPLNVEPQPIVDPIVEAATA